MTATVPHLAVPFRVDADGGFGAVEQDSGDDIAAAVLMVLSTRPGQRTVVPAFGVPELLFQRDIPVDAIAQAVTQWEPRTRIELISTIDPVDDLVRRLTVTIPTPPTSPPSEYVPGKPVVVTEIVDGGAPSPTAQPVVVDGVIDGGKP